MVAKSYQKPSPNARALTQVNAWLRAAEIPTKPASTPGCDLAIVTDDGRELQVKIAAGSAETVGADALVVFAKDLTSRHGAVALKAFHQITVAAGRGSPNPVALRGVEPLKKLHYDDNFELVSMRHKEFRRVPNPSTADLEVFTAVVRKAVRRFMFINTVICRRHLLAFEDLQTYAQVWTCNYLGLYKVENPTQNDNERKLYVYLCQRFAEFAKMIVKKERNCIPDSETASIASTGRPYAGPISARAGTFVGADWGEQSFEEAQEQELEAEVGFVSSQEPIYDPGLQEDPRQSADEEHQEQKLDDARRRKEAQKLLAEKLLALPHDKRIEALEAVAESSHVCYDARLEARKQLRLHHSSCQDCSPEV